MLDGDVLTAEAVRAVLRDACLRPVRPRRRMSSSPPSGRDTATIPASGPLPANLPIVIDLWPRDELSGCWADMTRTFVVGEIGDEVRALETLVRDALERAREAVRPGVTGRELHALACDVFESAGHRTQRTGPGERTRTRASSFRSATASACQSTRIRRLGQTGHDELVAGDVIAIEPGLWQRRSARCASRISSW